MAKTIIHISGIANRMSKEELTKNIGITLPKELVEKEIYIGLMMGLAVQREMSNNLIFVIEQMTSNDKNEKYKEKLLEEKYMHIFANKDVEAVQMFGISSLSLENTSLQNDYPIDVAKFQIGIRSKEEVEKNQYKIMTDCTNGIDENISTIINYAKIRASLLPLNAEDIMDLNMEFTDKYEDEVTEEDSAEKLSAYNLVIDAYKSTRKDHADKKEVQKIKN